MLSGSGRGERGGLVRTMVKLRARNAPFRAGKVAQYFSVRQGIFKGLRVIISKVNLVRGRAFAIVLAMARISSIPLPMGTSASRKPSAYSLTAMSLICVLMA